MKKYFWIIGGVVVLAFFAGAWVYRSHTQKSVGEEPVKIGAALPLTGAVASFGEEFRRGAEIAQDEINRSSDAVRVIFEDTALDPKKAVDAVNKLVYSDGIDALFISAYSEVTATHRITDQEDIASLVLWDSNPQIEAMGGKVFALGPWTPSSGEVTAEFAYQKDMKTAAIFGYNQEWSTDVSHAFKEKFVSLGGKVVSEEYSNPGATDYRTQLLKVLASNPDIVYMTTEDFLRGMKQIKDLGYKGVIITSDLLDNSQIEQNPGLFEGVYGSQVADPATAATSHFVDLYKKKYGENPKKILYGTWGYDAVYLLYKAYKDDPNNNIVKGLYNIQNYQGASGIVTFNERGTSRTIPKMFVVKDGVIVRSE